MAKKASVILTEAAERVRYGRWMQGDFYDRNKMGDGLDQVPVCAYGAIDYSSEMKNWAHDSIRWTKNRYLAWVAARDYARAAVPRGQALAEWNDKPGRTMTEVRTLLRKAAVLAARNGD